MDVTNQAANPFARLVRNIGWNVAGQLAPLLAALVSIPLLIKGLGVDRFGILTLAWMVIGYFSLFDFGIGRALTQIVSEKLAEKNHDAIPALIWTGLAVMLGLGIFGGLIMVVMSDWIIYSGLKIPLELQEEVRQSLLMLAPSVPLVVVATGLRGALEAKQDFKAVNLVRIPLGVLMFIAPVFVLPYSNSLVTIFFVLMLVRLVTVLVFLYLTDRSISNFRAVKMSTSVLPQLLAFGGWMTVSNIISPIMVQMDRFFIGAMLSMAAVAYYTTPYEMISKLLIVPGGIAGVCFPAFSRLLAEKNLDEAKALYWRCCKYVGLLMLPVVALVILLANPILELWLSREFAIQGGDVLRILAVGMLINGLAHIPFAFVQGAKRPDITAKLHAAELFAYLVLLYFCIQYFGINGAAIAWVVRVTVDAAALFLIVAKGDAILYQAKAGKN